MHKEKQCILLFSPTFLCSLLSPSYFPFSPLFFGCESEARRRPGAGGKADWEDAG